MTGRIFEDGRKVDSLKVAEPEYHYEYIAVHAQRVALIRNYTIWYVVGLAISMSMFWLVLWAGATSTPILVRRIFRDHVGYIGTTVG